MNGVTLVLIGLFVAVASSLCFGAENYRQPPKQIVDLIDAAPTPEIEISPDGMWMLQSSRDALPTVEEISRRMLRLAGMRIDPVANSRFRTSFRKSIALRSRDDATLQEIPLPSGAKLADTLWSHDSQAFAFTTVSEAGSQLWAATVANPEKPVLLSDRLTTVTESIQWMPNGKQLLCLLVPDDRGTEPEMSRVPSGPNVQETDGDTSPTRTYQDLLANVQDEALFDHYAHGQLAIIDLDGQANKIGDPRIYWRVEPSPNGEFLLLKSLQRPYSYLQTARSFPQLVEVCDLQGKLIHEVAKIPLAENIPIEGVRTGPRRITWRSGAPASLVWFEALDGGDPRAEAPHRDRMMRLDAPFKEPAYETVRLEHRAVGASFMRDSESLITYEYDRDRRWIRSLLHDAESNVSPKVLMDRSVRDRYGDPGSLVTEPDETGHSVVMQRGKKIYRTGMGATPDGNLPFLDEQDLDSLETERLWRCESGRFEYVTALVEDDERMTFVTRRQSPDAPPNYFHYGENNEARALTDFHDPTPQIRGIKKQLVKYERSDGVPLSATMYLPADHQEGERLPLLIWAYPIEFNDADTAGQVASSPWRFTTIRGSSHLALLQSGFAVMDGATMPIVGHPETMNDTFVEQLVASAQAAIDKAVEMGVADRERVAVGGHSYGAFMTANLLAHCDLFKAGIARSGAYNRTLTPFGFQSERRPLWEAREIYFSISPFMHADKIKAPLLMFHGEEDNNSGTFPMQSKRLFQAIKGNGGIARLVMLPEESHGYRARESVMHVQAETLEWLDRYVKSASGGSAE